MYVNMERSSLTLILLMTILGCSFMPERANALIHIVGGSFGWDIPPNGTFYLEWAKPQTFIVGDELLFMYRPGTHNVYVVDKTDYKDCGQDHVIDQFVDGPTRYKLGKKGDYYFYSGIGLHCEAGQKLHIKVGDRAEGESFGRSLMAQLPASQEKDDSSDQPLGFIHFKKRRLLAL